MNKIEFKLIKVFIHIAAIITLTQYYYRRSSLVIIYLLFLTQIVV
jgi:hypothetical protein